MFQLPKFAIVVWVRKTANYQATHDEILELAVQEPYESTEYQGMVDFHWGFDQMAGFPNGWEACAVRSAVMPDSLGQIS